MFGVQVGASIVVNGDKDSKDAYLNDQVVKDVFDNVKDDKGQWHASPYAKYQYYWKAIPVLKTFIVD